VNKSDAPIHNYIEMFKVPFTYREDGNYRDLIMKMMNELMKNVDGFTDSSP